MKTKSDRAELKTMIYAWSAAEEAYRRAIKATMDAYTSIKNSKETCIFESLIKKTKKNGAIAANLKSEAESVERQINGIR